MAESRWRRAASGQWAARADDADAMRLLGADLAALLRAGDVVILDGPLGAGKTTLTQGIGAALGVRGAVTSPTFVIARVHPGGPAPLVHVDAYRLADAVEVDDLDLDADVADAITIVEWGAGKVEGLSPDRLEVTITRAFPQAVGSEGADDPAGGVRAVMVRGVGERWRDLRLGGH